MLAREKHAGQMQMRMHEQKKKSLKNDYVKTNTNYVIFKQKKALNASKCCISKAERCVHTAQHAALAVWNFFSDLAVVT